MEILVIKDAPSFWILLAGFALAGLCLFGARASKRRKLGKVLWASPWTAQRWFAIAWLVVVGLWIAAVAMGLATPVVDLTFIWACFLVSLWVCLRPLPFQVSVHEGGVCIGLFCFPWREIASWSWGPNAGPGDIVWLSSRDRNRLGLCIWITSLWRLLYDLRPGRPIRTRIAHDGDLEALLRQYAPKAELSSQAAL